MSEEATPEVQSEEFEVQAPDVEDQTPDTAPEVEDNAEPTQNNRDIQRLKKEAAKYRTQLRDVEAERDNLHAQVEAMQRTQIESVLKDKLDKPSSFWLADHKPAEFYTEDGELDSDKLNTAADTAIETIGLARARRFKGSAGQGVRQTTSPAPTTWAGIR